MVERGTGVSDGMVERTLRARSLFGCMSDVLCVELISQKVYPFSGVPCPPFYRPRGSRGYRWEKEENAEGIEGLLRELGLPFSLCLPCLTWQTVLEVACSLILVGHALASFSKWVRPILHRWTVRRGGEPSYDRLGVIGEVTIRPSL